MDKNIFPEFLFSEDILRLRKNRLKHIRKRIWAFFRRIGENRLLLINERRPLAFHVRNVDWESFRREKPL